MQGCARSSRTSRSAKSPLPTRRRLGLFRSCHPIPSIGWRKPAAYRRPGSSTAPHVSAGSRAIRTGCMVVSRRRAERRLRLLGRFARQLTTRISCSSKLTRPLPGAAHSRNPPPITTARVDVRQLSEVHERPRRPGNSDRGQGIQVHRRVPAAGPPAHLHRYGCGGHDPLSLLRDAVPFRPAINIVRCRPAGQFLC